ncbi:MAG: ArnT family glycosyltransferase [Methylophilus sp.]
MKPAPAHLSSASTLTWLTRLFWLGLIAWVALTFRQHGISNDEYVQHTYGQMLLDWYSSGFTDQDAFHYRNLYLYGGLFDIIAAALDIYIPIMIWDIRHLLSALFGLLGFYGVSRFANLLGGQRLAIVSMLMLLLTVSWSGAMFTHTKDVPFAACMLWALYATALVVRDMENVSGKAIVLLGFAVGGALGLRVGGAFAVIYLILLVTWRAWLDHKANGSPVLSRLLRMVLVLLPAAVLAFVFMAICWPWSVIDVDNILEAAESFSHFDFNMQTMANGVMYNISDVPRSYLFQYLAVKLPEAALLGLATVPLLWLICRSAVQAADIKTRITMHTLLAGILLPLMFVLNDKPALYNGVRHFTFLLPLLAILAAWAVLIVYDALANSRWFGRIVYQSLWAGVVAGLMLVTFVDIVQLHPFEYVRLNRLVGDQKQAQFNWEGDYWSSALREATDQLQAMKLPARSQPYWIGACVDTPQIEPYLDRRFKVTRRWEEADFYISTTNMHCHEVMKGKVIVDIERQGMSLAVVKDRRNLQANDRSATPAKN